MFEITKRGHYNPESNDPYLDRNARNKAALNAPKPPTKPLFGFDEMKPGDWFDLDFPTGKEESMRSMLHQNARLAGIWIKTYVKKADKKTTTFGVIHDGRRI